MAAMRLKGDRMIRYARIAFTSLILMAAPALTGQCRRGMGPGPARYDAASESAINGTIEDVQQITRGPWGGGTHLSVRTADRVYDVHLGPTAWITRQGFTFAKGDHVDVVGCTGACAGKDGLIAREVTRAGRVLTLRDKSGVPQWSGGRGRP
jgi:hypothetical protein